MLKSSRKWCRGYYASWEWRVDQVLTWKRLYFQKIKRWPFANKVRGKQFKLILLKEDQDRIAWSFRLSFPFGLMGRAGQYSSRNSIRILFSVSISGYHIAELRQIRSHFNWALELSQLDLLTWSIIVSRGMGHQNSVCSNLSLSFRNGNLTAEYAGSLGRVAKKNLGVKVQWSWNMVAKNLKRSQNAEDVDHYSGPFRKESWATRQKKLTLFQRWYRTTTFRRAIYAIFLWF